MKAGELFGGSVLLVLLISGVMFATRNSLPDNAANNAQAQAAQSSSEPQLREWHSQYNGVDVVCFQSVQSPDSRAILTNPTNQQIADGAVVIKNTDPSDEAWNSACGGQLSP